MIYEAMTFAMMEHRNQVRKYTGEPYWKHLSEVAAITATVINNPEAIAVAWLHDCVEDQDIEMDELDTRFGGNVANGVMWLSDMETGNRAERKRMSCERLSRAPSWVQTIKCADLISNTSSIVLHDPSFAVVYLKEKRALLDAMTKADRRLWSIANAQI